MKRTKTIRRTKKTANSLIILLLTAVMLFLFVLTGAGIAKKAEDIDHYHASMDEGSVFMVEYQTLSRLNNSGALTGSLFPAGAEKANENLWNVMNVVILTAGMVSLGILYMSDITRNRTGRKISTSKTGRTVKIRD